MYLCFKPKMRKLVKRVFERHTSGKNEKKSEGNVVISSVASNVNELEKIVQKYQNVDVDYSLENQRVELEEDQLEEYVIDRNQSKQDYFLFCRDEARPKVVYQVKNNPLLARNALQDIHRQAERIKSRNAI